jgi:hypothetical protein
MINMPVLLNVLELPIVDILGMGSAGLGFLLAFLSFRMLSREQRNESVRKPMLYAVYVFMVFSIVLCMIGIFGQPLTAAGNPVEPVDNSDNQAHCQKMLTDVKNELAVCRNDSEQNIGPNSLSLISSRYFPAGMTKDSALLQIRRLLETEEEVRKNRLHFAYTLFEIEKQMQGKNINLRLENTADRETYRSIQRALQGLERYNGELNGDRQATYQAVVRFQQWLNQVNSHEGGPYIKPANFGIFGTRTLEAIRTQYRLRSAEG